MSLDSGMRLGSYEIIGLLGRGGMGEVYRAHDPKLDRDVALKVLPIAIALEPERLARFEREAKTLAAINHPHIAHIYGFEQVNGTSVLVMELVEGEDLSERIARGALPIEEALPIAREIAEALAAAHEQGIIHRDLKPANLKVRADGALKVLDFGLAKAMEPAETAGVAESAGSPTITTPAMTMRGVILGTAAYMAPEQAKGKPLDKRADIWAFGCVFYEMLTGKRAFDGADVTDVLGAVVRLEPDWSLIPPDVSAAIRTLLRACLAKDRRERVADMSTVSFVLQHAAQLTPASVPQAGHPSNGELSATHRRARWQYVMVAVVGSLVLAGVAAGVTREISRPVAPRVTRFTITPPQDEPFTSNIGGVNFAISPDGSTIVYQVQRGETVQLFARLLNQLDARPIPGTEGAAFPFFSPNGLQVGFLVGAKLKRVAIAGGPVFTVCDAPGRVNLSWASDDSIIFDSENTKGAIFRVASTGGQPQQLAAPDPAKNESRFRAAELLPDGKTLLFTIPGILVDEGRIAVRSLATGEQKTIVEGGESAHYVSTGHIVYGRSNALMAVPFDLSRLEVTGPSVAIQDTPALKVGGGPRFAVADNGTLVYAPGSQGESGPARFVWMDRDGRQLQPAVPTVLENPRDPRISPDGRSLAAVVGPADEGQIWVFDLSAAKQPLKLTFKNSNSVPVWSHDGKRILFASRLNGRQGKRNLMSVAADGTVMESELVAADAGGQLALSPDGRWIVFGRDGGPASDSDLWFKSTDSGADPRLWLQTAFRDSEPSFSPDANWLAYMSNPTGTPEIWVRPFPGPGAPVRVSEQGGHDPIWSRDGKELFFQDKGRLMSVTVSASSSDGIRFTPPRKLFEGGFIPWRAFLDRTFDVSPDGRFVMMGEVSGNTLSGAQFVVVLNWFEELKSRAPSNR